MDGEAAVTTSVSAGGAYTYLEATDRDSGLDLTGRHPHHGNVRVSWHPVRTGFRAAVRGTFYSSWIAARTTQPGGGVVDTVAPRFTLWDLFVSQRVRGGLSAFLNLENFADSQDPNTGQLLPTGVPAPIYRPEAGRSVRIGVQWSLSAR